MPEIDARLVYVACADAAEAERIGRAAVEARLAACANVIPGMRSIYRWEGAVEEAAEAVLVLKTTSGRFPALRDAVVAAHSYAVPCVVALPIVDGSAPYLAWLAESVTDA